MKTILFLLALIAAGCASDDAKNVNVFDQTGGAARLPSGQNLKMTKFVAPEYPAELRRSGVGGVVELQFSVLHDGSVTNISVAKPAHPALDKLAIAAVSQWRFDPYVPRSSTTTRLQVPVTFEVGK